MEKTQKVKKDAEKEGTINRKKKMLNGEVDEEKG